MKAHKLISSIIMTTIGLMLIASSLVHAQGNELNISLSDPAKRGKLKVHLNSGTIVVKGTPRKDILLKYKVREDEKEASKNVKDGMHRIGKNNINMEISENQNNVNMKSDSWHDKAEVEIEVPVGFDLQLYTYNDGDLIIKNIQGALELNNYNGAITAENISGSVVATTYNGDVKVTFDKITADTPMSFSTFNGDIDLSCPASLKATLKMKSERGEIYTGFDVNMVKTNPVQKKDTQSGVNRITIEEWNIAEVNGGGPEITMKNYNGNIYIRKK